QAWSTVKANAALFLPAPNVFIPDNLELHERPPSLPKHPIVVYTSPVVTVWHKLDDTFLKPKANICALFFLLFIPPLSALQLSVACGADARITSPLAYSSPRNTVLAKLFTKMLTESLNEYAYAADIAGLTYEITSSVFGFEVRHNQVLLLHNRFLSFPPPF